MTCDLEGDWPAESTTESPVVPFTFPLERDSGRELATLILTFRSLKIDMESSSNKPLRNHICYKWLQVWTKASPGPRLGTWLPITVTTDPLLTNTSADTPLKISWDKNVVALVPVLKPSHGVASGSLSCHVSPSSAEDRQDEADVTPSSAAQQVMQ